MAFKAQAVGSFVYSGFCVMGFRNFRTQHAQTRNRKILRDNFASRWPSEREADSSP